MLKMKTRKPANWLSWVFGIPLILPLIYVAFCWWVGLNYGREPIERGVYKVWMSTEIHDAMKRGEALWGVVLDLEGSKKEDLEIKKRAEKPGPFQRILDYVYEEREIMFSYPRTEIVTFPNKESGFGDGNYRERKYEVLHYMGYSSYSSFSPKKPWQYCVVSEKNIEKILSRGNGEDLANWKRYDWLRKFQDKFEWMVDYSPFLAEDYLGMAGCFLLWLTWVLKDLRFWGYYLYLVAAFSFGRVGYWSPNLAFTKEGWMAIFYNLFDWIGELPIKLFTCLALLISIPVVFMICYTYLTKHFLPRKKREIEDFLKVDKDKAKRDETAIDRVEFKEVNFDIAKRLQTYVKKGEYFLGVDDNKKDITIKEQMLTYHTHIMGSTGSGKTSMGILPLGHQALENGRGCCFIDFKGDDVLKKYIQQKAIEKGKKFYYFSIDSTENSVTYNPLLSGDIDSKVDRIMSALELVYEGPAWFYSNVQAMAFRDLLEEMLNEKQEITFTAIARALVDGNILARIDADPREIKGLLAAVSRIAKIRVINTGGVDLSEIIKGEDVVFFALKSQINTQLAEAIGKMLIIDIKAQAARRNELDPLFFIFIDEFQNIACKHFVDVISKIRSANFCLVLSNQSRGNLMTVSPGFENAIFDNTATKIIFNQENPNDAAFWSDKSGQTTYSEKNTLQFDGVGVDGEKTILDGKR